MSQTKTTEPLVFHDELQPPKSPRARKIATIIAIAAAALVVVAALLLWLSPQVDDAPPTSLGFSLNSFFIWLGGLNPIVQIPIVLIVFGAVVGLVLLLIEFAPRRGRGYMWLRVVACFAIPLLAFMLLRPYQNALVYVLAIALGVGALLFFADYRSREGAGYVFQLVVFHQQ